jgi:hypothetical protein
MMLELLGVDDDALGMVAPDLPHARESAVIELERGVTVGSDAPADTRGGQAHDKLQQDQQLRRSQ